MSINKEDFEKVFKTIIKNINEEDDQKEINQISELKDILVDLIKKMNNSTDFTEFNRLKEVYNITNERLQTMKQERTEKYDKLLYKVISEYENEEGTD